MEKTSDVSQVWVAYGAALLTTVAFVPQAYKIYSTKDTEGVSVTTYVVYAVGLMMWLVFALLNDSRPTILSSLGSLAIAGVIIYTTLQNRKLVLTKKGTMRLKRVKRKESDFKGFD